MLSSSIKSIALMSFALVLAVVACLYGLLTSDWPHATALEVAALLFVVSSLVLVQKESSETMEKQTRNILESNEKIATRHARIETNFGLRVRGRENAQMPIDELDQDEDVA